jgi:hypothetical protein
MNEKDDSRPTPLPSFATVPPPSGAVDEHSAATMVAALPDSFLNELKSAAKQEVELRSDARSGGRELAATTRHRAYDLELREKLTAQLVDIVAPPPGPVVVPAPPAAPASPPAPASAEPAPATDDEVIAPAPGKPAIDAGRVFLLVLVALIGIAMIAWTYIARLR